MRRSFRFLALLACALPLACSDTSTTPTALAPPPAPRLSANLDSNGSLVFRSEGGWWWWYWTDTEKNLTAMHANFQMPEAFCGGTPLWMPPFVQSVVSGKYEAPEQLVHLLIRAPDVFTYVFAGGIPPCWAVPVASGMAHLVYTDSDWFGDPDRPQAAAWGATVEGQLTGAGGQLYHYNGHLRAMWSDGTHKEQIKINLQPLGQ